MRIIPSGPAAHRLLYLSLTHVLSPPVGVTQLNSSLLMMSVIALLIPAAFHFTAGEMIEDPQEAVDILAVSHGVRQISFGLS